jgi:predicted RNA-binding protein with PIN domain
MTAWIVDAMNVIGSRPTGWWRDRDAAIRRLADAIGRFVAATGDRVTLVVDGRPGPDLPAGEHQGVLVVYARRTGANAADDRIVELVASAADSVRVVTSDRDLRARVRRLGAQVVGAGTWLRELEQSVAR